MNVGASGFAGRDPGALGPEAARGESPSSELASTERSLPQVPGPFRSWLASIRSTGTIASVFLVSLAFVLGLVTLLNYFKFESYSTEIAERRIGIIIERVHNSIEVALRLGLNLEDIEIARTVLGNTMAQDPLIDSISIFSTDSGRMVFASDPATIGAAAEQSWLNAQARVAGDAWRIEAGNLVVVGRRLDSNLAKGIGGVVLVYSLADLHAAQGAMRNELIWAAVATFAVCSVIAVFGALLVTRDFRRTLAGLSDAIGAAHAGSGAVLPESLRTSVDRFRQVTSEAGLQLDRFEEALPKESAADRPKPAQPAGALG